MITKPNRHTTLLKLTDHCLSSLIGCVVRCSHLHNDRLDAQLSQSDAIVGIYTGAMPTDLPQPNDVITACHCHVTLLGGGIHSLGGSVYITQ